MFDILKLMGLLRAIQAQLVQALQEPGAKAPMDNLREAYRHISIAISYMEIADNKKASLWHEATRI